MTTKAKATELSPLPNHPWLKTEPQRMRQTGGPPIGHPFHAAYHAIPFDASSREIAWLSWQAASLAVKEAELQEAAMKHVTLFGELQSATEQVAVLRDAGAQLANCAFNLSQAAGKVLSERDAKSLKEAQVRWDDALTQGAQT